MTASALPGKPPSTRAARARAPARPSAAVRPSWSISSLLAMPTEEWTAQRLTCGASSTRRRSGRSFESRKPRGTLRSRSTTQRPSATGPAIAPLPTSSQPTTNRAPSAARAFSRRSDGGRDDAGFRAVRSATGLVHALERLGVVVQPSPPVEGPADHERAADHVVDRDEPLARLVRVVPGVAGVVAVVAHHPEGALRHRDVEVEVAHLGDPGRQLQVGLVERHAV